MTGLVVCTEDLRPDQTVSQELTRIRGIGATKKRWLESIGIGSLQDLAIASVDEIKTQLKRQGCIASPSEIKLWIAQARQLATPIPEPIREDKPRSPAIALSLAPTAPLIASDLQSTSIPRSQSTSASITTPRSQSESTPFSSSTVQSTSSIAITIHQLRLLDFYQPCYFLMATEQQRAFVGAIARETLVSLEVALTFSGLPLDNPLDAYLRYQVQGYARHLASGATVDFGTTVVDALIGDRDVYTAILPKATFRQAGVYRLKVNAALLDLSCAAASFKVPVLNVV